MARLLVAVEKRARNPWGAMGMALVVINVFAWLCTGEGMCAAWAITMAVLVALVDTEAPRG